jgi:SAM-dependent methyltransferase
MESHQVNLDFAKAWDNSRGTFAEEFAENLINFANANNIKMKSIIDICCGSSNLLRVFKDKGFTCIGTESRDGMLEYSKENNPGITYLKTKNMFDIPIKQKVDLITCTGDIVNYFETFDNWLTFFKEAEKHLNGKGLFVFDFYTKSKLKNWNETTFTSSDWLDCLTSVKSGLYDKTVINYTYYINYQNYMVKTRDIVVESYYETDTIVSALKKCGFKNVTLTNKNLEPVSDTEIQERIHVVAKKK